LESISALAKAVGSTALMVVTFLSNAPFTLMLVRLVATKELEACPENEAKATAPVTAVAERIKERENFIVSTGIIIELDIAMRVISLERDKVTNFALA